MNREDLIALAAETLGCTGQTAAGKWLYHDPATGWWIVTDDDMEELGALLNAMPEDANAAVATWCDPDAGTTATEVDISLMFEFATSATDLDVLLRKANADGDVVTWLVLAHARADVREAIRLNEEMQAEPLATRPRTRSEMADDHRWDPDYSDDFFSRDREGTW